MNIVTTRDLVIRPQMTFLAAICALPPSFAPLSPLLSLAAGDSYRRSGACRHSDPPDGQAERGREGEIGSAHIASASVSWRDKIKFLDGGLVLRPNTLGRRREGESTKIISIGRMLARPMIICSKGSQDG